MEYKRMYREARYALSPRKGGWETMRIYEILASGSVPFIKDVDAIPGGALAFLDKELIRHAMALPGVDHVNLRVHDRTFQFETYEMLAAALLRHTQQRLSTEALARYMLAAVGRPHATHVLYVANCGHGDYQCYLSLHGLRSILGTGLVDVPKLPYMYRPHLRAMEEMQRTTVCPQPLCTVLTGSFSRPVVKSHGAQSPVYGGGFSYGFRLEEVALNRSQTLIMRQIRGREFDLVVFGNAELQDFRDDATGRLIRRLWELIQHHYTPGETLVIDGRDPPKHAGFHPGVEPLAARAQYFLREIPEC
mmetsp:Transcript_52761/g.122795  ORF Transcript_52761/g.122795 Transcript_52761/m.122795 type:complete len:305 (+) Transcript_52761:1-915(+)